MSLVKKDYSAYQLEQLIWKILKICDDHDALSSKSVYSDPEKLRLISNILLALAGEERDAGDLERKVVQTVLRSCRSKCKNADVDVAGENGHREESDLDILHSVFQSLAPAGKERTLELARRLAGSGRTPAP